MSYLTEQVLYATGSEYNDYLHVSLVHGRLQLVAQDAIYSFGDYYLNFRKLLEVFDFSQLPERANVLVLGLGLGSIIELLEKLVEVDYDYVAVEIDPEIIDLAAFYSLPHLSSPVEVREADALTFLQLDARRYDLICVDVFQDATVPDHLNATDFLELLAETLAPGGALIYNRLASTPSDKAAARAYFEEQFRPAFPAATLYDTGGNYLLLNEGRFVGR